MLVRGPTFVLLCLTASVVATLPGAATSDADDDYHLHARVKATTDLDILVTGVDDPIVGRSIRDAITAWETGIRHFAAPWLAENLTFRTYFPAHDPVPPAGFEPHHLEILFVPQGFMAISGSSGPCLATAPLAQEYLSYGASALFRVSAHEFGHCLGLGHVYHHGVEYSPGFDLMGGGRAWACPSNLDVFALERAFGYPHDRPFGGWSHIAPSEYTQAPDCLVTP